MKSTDYIEIDQKFSKMAIERVVQGSIISNENNK
jgi:hypothetical protein